MAENPYDRDLRRKAEFIRPPHPLKAKVGGGGISDHIVDRAQKLLEHSSEEFKPQAEMYLNTMTQGVQKALLRLSKPEDADENESAIAMIMYPAIQLRANGGLFNYPLISTISERLIKFMEVIDTPDAEVLDIVNAFQTTMRLVLAGSVSGEGGDQGQALIKELDEACERYFEKRGE